MTEIGKQEVGLVEINLLSGAITVIGSIPYAVQGLATGPDGLLYGWNVTERSVHVFDDSGTLLSTTSFASEATRFSNIQALEFIGDQLVAHHFTSSPVGVTLDAVDLASGTLSPIAEIEPLYSIRALGWSSVPEPGSIPLIVLASCLLCLPRSRPLNAC